MTEPTPAEKFEQLLADPVAYRAAARARARAAAERDVVRAIARKAAERREGRMYRRRFGVKRNDATTAQRIRDWWARP